MSKSFRNSLISVLTVGSVAFALPAIGLPSGVGQTLWGLAMAVIFATPFVMSLAAGQQAIEDRLRTAQEGSFLSSVGAAFDRRRLLLIIAVGMIPLVGMQGAVVAEEMAIELNAGCLDGCFWPIFMPRPDFAQALPLLRVVFTAWGIGFLGVSLAAAALGSGLTICRRSAVQALLLAAPVILLLTFAAASWWPSTTYALLGSSHDPAQSRTIAAGLAASFVLAPLSVGYLILRVVKFLYGRKRRPTHPDGT